jgi:hypothetical protein
MTDTNRKYQLPPELPPEDPQMTVEALKHVVQELTHKIHFLVAWADENDFPRARSFAADGTPLAGAFQVGVVEQDYQRDTRLAYFVGARYIWLLGLHAAMGDLEGHIRDAGYMPGLVQAL